MLNKQQIDQYNDEGFTIFSNFLNSAQIQLFIEEIEMITRGNTLVKHDTSKMEMEPDQEKMRNKVTDVTQSLRKSLIVLMVKILSNFKIKMISTS
jgi:hypothetical protein